MLMTMPRASDAQQAHRLNRARTCFSKAFPFRRAQRLAQECSLSPRQAYRYFDQAASCLRWPPDLLLTTGKIFEVELASRTPLGSGWQGAVLL